MKTFGSLILCLLASTGTLALPARTAAQSGSRFFPAKDLMTVGVYYYPEHWPQEQWERDFAKMEEMGFEFVHMANSPGLSWSRRKGGSISHGLIAPSSWPLVITCECCFVRRLLARPRGWERSILRLSSSAPMAVAASTARAATTRLPTRPI